MTDQNRELDDLERALRTELRQVAPPRDQLTMQRMTDVAMTTPSRPSRQWAAPAAAAAVVALAGVGVGAAVVPRHATSNHAASQVPAPPRLLCTTPQLTAGEQTHWLSAADEVRVPHVLSRIPDGVGTPTPFELITVKFPNGVRASYTWLPDQQWFGLLGVINVGVPSTSGRRYVVLACQDSSAPAN